MISLVAAKARNGVIGSRNDLPWYLPADLRRFKEITLGHTVVMGRRTLESIMGRLGTPLPERRNIVLTRKQAMYPGVEVMHDIRELRNIRDDIYIIGGAEVYAQTFDMVDRLYLTEIHADIAGDVYFPEFDITKWREVSRELHPRDEKHPYDFDFVIYDRL